MPTVAIKTKGGGTAGEVSLSERVFGATRNIPLMHQAVRAELENSRQDTRNTKTRGDMDWGGKKPFRQKGTGRSRQGTTTAPHWRKGGVAHGPHPRDLSHSLPKKMRRQAIRSALSAKLADGELIIIDQIPLEGAISTKIAAAFIGEIVPNAKKVLVIVEEHQEVTWKSLRNIANVTVRVAPQFSTRDVVDGGIVLITRAAAEKIDATWNDGKVVVAKASTGETEGDE
jgi:large subunit ribosomal protein L4